MFAARQINDLPRFLFKEHVAHEGGHMRCYVCGAQAPTMYVEFYENIGAFFMRFSKEVKGELCKPCIHKNFWKMTMTTATIGWFGIISMIVSPCFILINLWYYCGALSLKPPREVDNRPREDHATLSLTPQARTAIQPFAQELFSRLDAGENMDKVTFSIAPRAGVTVVQLELFIEAENKNRKSA